jgi:hypothetical protein
MRYLLFLFSSTALAHAGHGKAGLQHFHEFSDGLLVGVALAAVVLLAWAWKK